MKTAIIGLVALIAASSCNAEESMISTSFAGCATIALHKLFLLCVDKHDSDDKSLMQTLAYCTDVVYLSDPEIGGAYITEACKE